MLDSWGVVPPFRALASSVAFHLAWQNANGASHSAPHRQLQLAADVRTQNVCTVMKLPKEPSSPTLHRPSIPTPLKGRVVMPQNLVVTECDSPVGHIAGPIAFQ